MKLFKFIILFLLITTIGCEEDTIDYQGTGTISGRTVAAFTFEPINNAKITLTPSNNTVFTDEEGYFTFKEVEALEYSVTAEKKGFLTGFEPAVASHNLEINIVFELQEENINNRPPSTPILLSPDDNSIDTNLSVELRWDSTDPDEDEITYKLKLRNNKNSDELLIENIKDTTYVLSSLLNKTKYSWQISASDSINAEVWSEIFNFTTKENTASRKLFVREEFGKNIIYEFTSDSIQRAITSSDKDSWRPRKNNISQKIAFLQTDENFETHIYTMNTDGSNRFKVTNTVPLKGFNQSELDFSWSANGDKFIYPQYDKLYEINKDGTGLRLIYQTPNGSFISECDWSNDGEIIALKTNDSNGYNISIYTIDLNGNINAVVLSGVKGAGGGINLSIDNNYLLYTHDISKFENTDYRQLDTHIFRFEFSSNELLDLSKDKPNGTIDIDPRFSPNEAEIIFVNTSNDGISVKTVYEARATNGTSNRKELFENAMMPDWE